MAWWASVGTRIVTHRGPTSVQRHESPPRINRNHRRTLIHEEPEIYGLPWENVEDLRRNETELRQNAGGDGSGSEFSIGAGLEAPWTARRAAAQYRYTQPCDFGGGGKYHGTSPPMTIRPGYPTPPPRPGVRRPKSQGSKQLRRFLTHNG